MKTAYDLLNTVHKLYGPYAALKAHGLLILRATTEEQRIEANEALQKLSYESTMDNAVECTKMNAFEHFLSEQMTRTITLV